jgi:hypothetical protein
VPALAEATSIETTAKAAAAQTQFSREDRASLIESRGTHFVPCELCTAPPRIEEATSQWLGSMRVMPHPKTADVIQTYMAFFKQRERLLKNL